MAGVRSDTRTSCPQARTRVGSPPAWSSRTSPCSRPDHLLLALVWLCLWLCGSFWQCLLEPQLCLDTMLSSAFLRPSPDLGASAERTQDTLWCVFLKRRAEQKTVLWGTLQPRAFAAPDRQPGPGRRCCAMRCSGGVLEPWKPYSRRGEE